MRRGLGGLLGAVGLVAVACGSSGSEDGGSAGSGGGSGCHPDTASAATTCGSSSCTAGQICVQPCCGGADTGVPCTPDPPYCVDASALDCTGCSNGGPPSQCSYTTGGCFSGNISGQQLTCMCA